LHNAVTRPPPVKKYGKAIGMKLRSMIAKCLQAKEKGQIAEDLANSQASEAKLTDELQGSQSEVRGSGCECVCVIRCVYVQEMMRSARSCGTRPHNNDYSAHSTSVLYEKHP